MGSSKRDNPDKSEVYLAMRTLRDMNMSKFVAEDVPLFCRSSTTSSPARKRTRRRSPTSRRRWPRWPPRRACSCTPRGSRSACSCTRRTRCGTGSCWWPHRSGKTAICETPPARHRDWGEARHLEDEPRRPSPRRRCSGAWTRARATGPRASSPCSGAEPPRRRKTPGSSWTASVDADLDREPQHRAGRQQVLTLANGDRVQMSGT